MNTQFDHNNEDSRLYVQLQPDSASRAHLLSVQSNLNASGINVIQDQLHMTIIHFGVIKNVLAQISESDAVKCAALDTYVQQTQQILDNVGEKLFVVSPKRLSLFGRNESTIVIEYEPTDDLIDLHTQCLSALYDFFKSLNVADPVKYMMRDHNFKFALHLRPHVTLIKRVRETITIDIKKPQLDKIMLRPMKLIY